MKYLYVRDLCIYERFVYERFMQERFMQERLKLSLTMQGCLLQCKAKRERDPARGLYAVYIGHLPVQPDHKLLYRW